MNKIEVLDEISQNLSTGLDKDALQLCLTMIENGANPEALAAVVKEIRRETQ